MFNLILYIKTLLIIHIYYNIIINQDLKKTNDFLFPTKTELYDLIMFIITNYII